MGSLAQVSALRHVLTPSSQLSGGHGGKGKREGCRRSQQHGNMQSPSSVAVGSDGSEIMCA